MTRHPDSEAIIQAQRREIRRLAQRCVELQDELLDANKRAADAEASRVRALVEGRAA